MGGEPAAAIDAHGVDAESVPGYGVGVDLQLDSLPGPDLSSGNGVAAGLKRDEAVLANPPEMALGDQIGPLRQRQ